MRSAIYLTVNDFYYKLGLAQAKHIASMHEDVDVYLFVETDENHQSSLSEDNLKVQFNQLTELMPTGLKTTQKLPLVAYARLFAPAILKTYDRILYLDADALVIRNCKPLLGTEEMQHKAIGAVTDQSYKARLKPEFVSNGPPLKLKSHFNSGVLLINPELYLEHDVSSALMKFTMEFSDAIRFADQDFLNHYFCDDILELNPRWNYQTPYMNYGFDLYEPAILHFTGRTCPWQPAQWQGDKIFCEMFCNLASKSGLKLEDFPVKTKDKEHHTMTRLKDKLRRAFWSSGIIKKPPTRKLETFFRDRDFFQKKVLLELERFNMSDSSEVSRLNEQPSIGFDGIQVYAKFPRSLASYSGLLNMSYTD